MTSLITRPVTLLLSCVIMTQCRAEDISISFTDLSAIFNGNFDNIDQVSDHMHDRIEMKVKPVLIPGLRKEPVIYLEEIINGNLYRLAVIVRNESSTDHILYVNLYNFTDSSRHDPGSFNTDDLANLTREDFRIESGCEASNVQLFPGVLFSQVSDCRHVVNGQHPIYTYYTTCDGLRFESPLESNETTSLLAFDLKQMGPRFPLVGAPEGYVNPCQDGK